ncbi:glycosyltransferase [Rhodococcus sp. 14-1411-2a]|uniref:glycosyltransferase n=1 Tax=Rhodococcus sp. 14-1411-2a TaxID=2023151 RepID=UPI000B9A419A|nr:glycosyltransferase family 2 protein [Rhodococcus sp. 14-1411-2a]OZF54102.1 glycosyl transferase family 2 [Rhodococcus sp. 14-1411-2a]
MTAPTLSVIIPAFDEEDYIGPCLSALLEQSEYIHELIVVDNNSSDATVDIVRSVQRENPMVRLISESEPGVVYARDAGFRVATGELLGRVDADTRVRPDWARQIVQYFAANPESDVAAVTGLNNSYDSPFRTLKGHWVQKQVEKGHFGGIQKFPNLHGANMALRRDAWNAVEHSVSCRDDIHEDLDLALCVDAAGGRIMQLTDLMVDISPRRALTPPSEFTSYLDAISVTYELHGRNTETLQKSLKLRWWFHAFLWLLHLPYDPQRGRYSVRRLLAPTTRRVLPIRTHTATRTADKSAEHSAAPS